MKRFVLSMSGLTVKQVSDTLRSILARLFSWSKNTAQKLFQAVCNYDYRFAAGIVLWSIRQRWERLLDRFPARQEREQWRNAYWALYDEWEKVDHEHRNLYAKHMDLNDELRYWETRHAKILNFVEKHMDETK